jgi:hypothetical protein
MPTSTPAPAGPIIDLSGASAAWFAVAILAGLVLVWGIPLALDARRAYRHQYRAWREIVARLERDASRGAGGLSLPEMQALLAEISRPPSGIVGLARSLMAFTIITILGFFLIALAFSHSTDAQDLRKTMITSLLSVLATIIGFYFGNKSSDRPAAPGGEPPPPPPGNEPGPDGASAGTGSDEASSKTP